MRARYAGWCPVCRERIGPGEEIVSAVGQDGWQHEVCPVTRGLPPTSSPKIHVARTGATGGRRRGHTRGIRKVS